MYNVTLESCVILNAYINTFTLECVFGHRIR